jgi:hypothetical protein
LVDKNAMQFDFEIAPVSFRSAEAHQARCTPTWESPISPSISAFVTMAATESMTTASTGAGAHERLADIQRLFAQSAAETRSESIFTPSACAE